MAALPYIQLYVADYLADTAHLSALEHGAYLMLIFNYWQRGESFKAKDKQSLNDRLARVARVSIDEWDYIRPVLEEFFVVTENEWRHSRIERDLEAVREKSEKAAAAGRASAERRATRKTAPPAPPVNTRSTSAQQPFNHTDTDTDTDKKPSTDVDGVKAPPTTPRRDLTVSRPIPPDWVPSEETYARLWQHAIPQSFAADLVPEFVLYWTEVGGVARTWDTKFFHHAQRKWRQAQAAPKQPPAPECLPKDWEPSRETWLALEDFGVDRAFAETLLAEFVIYWYDAKVAHASWNAKFIQHVQQKWAGRAVGARSTRDLSLDEQLTDRSWAEPPDIHLPPNVVPLGI